jgi:hypothetical protein
MRKPRKLMLGLVRALFEGEPPLDDMLTGPDWVIVRTDTGYDLFEYSGSEEESNIIHAWVDADDVRTVVTWHGDWLGDLTYTVDGRDISADSLATVEIHINNAPGGLTGSRSFTVPGDPERWHVLNWALGR